MISKPCKAKIGASFTLNFWIWRVSSELLIPWVGHAAWANAVMYMTMMTGTCALRWHLEHVESNICCKGSQCNYEAISQYALQLLALSPLLRPTFTFISTIFMRLILKVSVFEGVHVDVAPWAHACPCMPQHVATCCNCNLKCGKALRIWLHSLQHKVVSGDNMVTSSNFHIEGSWIHIPPNGPTSETNAPRDHDQYHPVKQEENGGIQGKVRKHEKIYWKYTSCAQIHPYSSVFIQFGISNCPTLGGSITMAPSTPGSESRSMTLLSGLSKSVCFSSCGHARRAWFSRFQICVLGWFLLHWTVYSKMPPSVCYAFVSQAVNRWQGKSPTLSTKLIVHSVQHF